MRPLRLVVGYPPGGPVDITARTMAADMAQALGQPIVIDNRPGAGGIVATELVAKSLADGHTLLLGTVSNAITPAVMPKLPFDVQRDLAPVTLLVVITSILAVHPGVAASSVQDLIALAKAKPGQLSYASTGSGTPGHLAAELFKSMAQVDLLHVPYKGAAPALVEVMSGRVHVVLLSAPGLLPHVKAGRLRALAVTNAKRSALLPDLPTIAESGLPGFEAEGWHGIFVASATPSAAVAALNRVLLAVLSISEVRTRLMSGGAEPVGLPPAQFAAKLRAEMQRWARVVKAANIKPD
ncbi:MAG: tripartite tricarboxylate transporter substrate binding protein [Burkholderiales bacterium]|nr:tripartite tricarboxylate transporter substrate binding protein [Burkholderiales bacterium]